MQLKQVSIEFHTEVGEYRYKFFVRDGKGVSLYRTQHKYFIPPSTQTLMEKNGKLVWCSLLTEGLLMYNFPDIEKAKDFVKETHGI